MITRVFAGRPPREQPSGAAPHCHVSNTVKAFWSHREKKPFENFDRRSPPWPKHCLSTFSSKRIKNVSKQKKYGLKWLERSSAVWELKLRALESQMGQGQGLALPAPSGGSRLQAKPAFHLRNKHSDGRHVASWLMWGWMRWYIRHTATTCSCFDFKDLKVCLFPGWDTVVRPSPPVRPRSGGDGSQGG